MTDFNTALDSFVTGSQKIIDEYFAKQFPNVPVPKLVVKRGRRYAKIVQKDYPESAGSAWAFIDTQNGNVLKPASWSAPAKHARGNIFDDHNGLGCIGPWGPAYLR